MRSRRFRIEKKSSQPGRVLPLPSGKANQASAHFGVVDVQSALLWGDGNKGTLNKTRPQANTTPPSRRLFKLALDVLLQAANHKRPGVEAAAGGTLLMRYSPRGPVGRTKQEERRHRTGYFDHRGSFQHTSTRCKGGGIF